MHPDLYKNDIIRCHQRRKADIRFHDGALPAVAGVMNRQIIRSVRDPQRAADQRGFTYNHAPMIAWAHRQYWLLYLGNPVSEHVPPTAAFLCHSTDGHSWHGPEEIFPSVKLPAQFYQGPGQADIEGDDLDCVIHHRMAFYTTSAGKLLVTTFYGISPRPDISPNNGHGAFRAVREIFADGSLSPIFMLRFNPNSGYDRSNTNTFPFYAESQDASFVKACSELLQDKLAVQQWWEEERFDDGFFTFKHAQALSYYTLPDHRVVAVFKHGLTNISVPGHPEIPQFEKPQRSNSLITANGKVWGQQTIDGRYALVYNPSTDGAHRWPLAVCDGDNGLDFGELYAIVPEIPPCRRQGLYKNLGAQYVRGISECNKQPDDNAMWLTYSMNKEDIWVSRVPVPLQKQKPDELVDDFSQLGQSIFFNNWNTFIPLWGDIRIDIPKSQGIEKSTNNQQLNITSSTDRHLIIESYDLYHRAIATRYFQAAPAMQVQLELKAAHDPGAPPSAVFFADERSLSPLEILVENDNLSIKRNGSVEPVCSVLEDISIICQVQFDAAKQYCHLLVWQIQNDQKTILYDKVIAYSSPADGICQISCYSKAKLFRQSLADHGKDGKMGDLPEADTRQPTSRLLVKKLSITKLSIS